MIIQFAERSFRYLLLHRFCPLVSITRGGLCQVNCSRVQASRTAVAREIDTRRMSTFEPSLNFTMLETDPIEYRD